MWIPLALAVTVIAAIGASSRGAGCIAEGTGGGTRAGVARAPSPPVADSAPPTAIATFNAFLRKGLEPPRQIAELARDEALAAGISDLAAEIEQIFGLVPRMPPRAPVRSGAVPQAAPAPARAPASSSLGDAAFLGVPGASAPSNSASAPGGDVALLGQPPAAMAPALTQEIPGVTAEQWSALCAQLERERPEYDSQRHVGRYRQSKDRLRDLGIDPAAIACNPAAQDDALAADLADAYGHLARAGVLERTIGKPIVLPDVDDAPRITLSGLLAVCHAAGLDHCANWLRSKTDRARFRHTTNLFLRCNGIF